MVVLCLNTRIHILFQMKRDEAYKVLGVDESTSETEVSYFIINTRSEIKPDLEPN